MSGVKLLIIMGYILSMNQNIYFIYAFLKKCKKRVQFLKETYGIQRSKKRRKLVDLRFPYMAEALWISDEIGLYSLIV